MSDSTLVGKISEIKTIKTWCKTVFDLSDKTEIEIVQTPLPLLDSPSVEITFTYVNGKTHHFSVEKKLADIELNDIQQLRDEFESHLIKHNPVLGRILRFLGMWFGFSGVFMMFSVCPVCGRPGCIVGVGFASIIGAIFSIILNLFRSFLGRTKK